MHGLMIAIEYSYKLDRKNYFNLWCELGRLLITRSQMYFMHLIFILARHRRSSEVFKPSARWPVAGAHLVSYNHFHSAKVCVCVCVCVCPRGHK